MAPKGHFKINWPLSKCIKKSSNFHLNDKKNLGFSIYFYVFGFSWRNGLIICFSYNFLGTFLWSCSKPENLRWCLALEVFSQWVVSPFYGVHAIICNTYSPKIGFLSHLCTLEHLQQLCILLWDFKVICWLLWQLSDKWLLYYGLS